VSSTTESREESSGEEKEEEKHASVIDVISHNRRHRSRKEKPVSFSCIFNVPLCTSLMIMSFTFFLHFTFFFSFFGPLSAHGYALMPRRRSRKGKIN
jgi:hypothetical protein